MSPPRSQHTMDVSSPEVTNVTPARLPFASLAEAAESIVTNFVQQAEAEAADEAHPTEDWHRLAELLHAIQAARHVLKVSLEELELLQNQGTLPMGPDRKHLDDFRQGRPKVRAAIDSLERAGHVVRAVLDKTIRPLMSPLGIFDLPDELLSEIFSNACTHPAMQDGFPFTFFFDPYELAKNGIQDLQNIRLTCRRFRDDSSHFLLRCIDVGLDRASLAHLDEVSRHPTISKGIMAVRVNLDMYTLRVQDEASFLLDALTLLGQRSNFYARRLADRRPLSYVPAVTREEMQEIHAHVTSIYDDWMAHWNRLREPDNELAHGPAVRNVAVFQRAFGEYVELAREQLAILEDGTLVNTVVQAMSRMPTATKLLMVDNIENRKRSRNLLPSSFAGSGLSNVEMCSDPYVFLYRQLVHTKSWNSWSDNESPEATRLPIGLLHKLPLEVMKAGTTLTRFDVFVSLPSTVHFEVHFSQHDISGLQSIGKSLRAFGYHGPSVPEHTNLKRLSEYLKALATGPNLRRLDIGAIAEGTTMPMGIFLRPTPKLSKDLEVCNLFDCAFHLHELKAFLGPFKPKSLHIYWKYTILLSGTWAEALDILREKAHRISILEGARGAECDVMPLGDVFAIFLRRFRHGPRSLSSGEYECSIATEYIQSMSVQKLQNPLLPIVAEVEDRDIQDHEAQGNDDPANADGDNH